MVLRIKNWESSTIFSKDMVERVKEHLILCKYFAEIQTNRIEGGKSTMDEGRRTKN